MADMNLDAPDPTPAPTPDPAAQPVAPTPPVDPDDAADEAVAVDTPQGKMVPLAALQSVRGELKTVKKEAAKVPQLEQYQRESQPYVQFLQQNPQLLQRQQPAPAPSPQDDPSLVALAQNLDFYKTDGSLDLAKAQKHRELVRSEAQQIAQQTMQPVAMNYYQNAAQQNYAKALQEKLPNGQAIDKSLLDVAWVAVQQRNPAALSDPNTIRFIVNNVIAEQMRANPFGFQQVQPPGRPPVHTEPVGNRPNQTNAMNDTQRAIVGQRMDDKKFGDLTKGFAPGRMNVLEED